MFNFKSKSLLPASETTLELVQETEFGPYGPKAIFADRGTTACKPYESPYKPNIFSRLASGVSAAAAATGQKVVQGVKNINADLEAAGARNEAERQARYDARVQGPSLANRLAGKISEKKSSLGARLTSVRDALNDPERRRQAGATIAAALKNPDTYAQMASSAAMGASVKALLGGGIASSLTPALILGSLTSVVVGNIQKEYKKANAHKPQVEINGVGRKLLSFAANTAKVTGFGLKHTLTGRILKTLYREVKEEPSAVFARAALGAAFGGIGWGLFGHGAGDAAQSVAENAAHAKAAALAASLHHAPAPAPDLTHVSASSPIVDEASKFLATKPDLLTEKLQHALDLAQHNDVSGLKDVAYAIDHDGLRADDYLVKELLAKAGEHAPVHHAAASLHTGAVHLAEPAPHAVQPPLVDTKLPVDPAFLTAPVAANDVASDVLTVGGTIVGGTAAAATATLAAPLVANGIAAMSLAASQPQDTPAPRVVQTCQMKDVENSSQVHVRCPETPEFADIRTGDKLRVEYTDPKTNISSSENIRNTGDALPTKQYEAAAMNDTTFLGGLASRLRGYARDKFNRATNAISADVANVANDNVIKPVATARALSFN